MPTTKYKLAEQVMFLLQDGDPSQSSSVEMEDIMEMLAQVINKQLKLSHFNETMADGSRIPNGLMLATYMNIAVTQMGTRSFALLPAVPLILPRGVGVFMVCPIVAGLPSFDCEYIPVPPGQWYLIQKEGLICDILGQVGYENFGIELLFTKDLTTLPVPVTQVMVRMAVLDISTLTDHDLLPIPADMEQDVIKETINMLAVQKPRLNQDDPTSENKGAN